jgi:hypothetical protein
VAEQRQGVAADLDDPRDGALADLLAELIRIEVRGDDERALVLVARVDDRVQLLEHPLAGVLRADVVEVQQVDAVEPVEQLERALLVADRVAQDVQQPRQRVDRAGPARGQRGLGDEHRQRRLAGPTSPKNQIPRPSSSERSTSRVKRRTCVTTDGSISVTGKRSKATSR